MKTEGMGNTSIVYNCHYHVMWCPKYRRKALVDGIDERRKVLVLIQETVERRGQEFVQVEIMPACGGVGRRKRVKAPRAHAGEAGTLSRE